MSEPLAWINDNRVPFSRAALPIWDLGVVAGAAVTELARTFAHRPFRLQQHVERLVGSCRNLGVRLDLSAEVLRDRATNLAQSNSRLIPPSADLGIVMFVTAGAHPTYLSGRPAASGTVCIHTFPLPFADWRLAATEGVRLVIPQVRQIPTTSLPIQHKIRNRMHWWLADQEASRVEPGARALLLDADDDCVTETSSSAFFTVIDGVVCTSDRGVLASLSARVVEDLCLSASISFQRRRVAVSELAQCSEAFLSSSASCILPVSRINGRAAGSTIPGPVCRQLQQAWSTLVGMDIVAQICSDAV